MKIYDYRRQLKIYLAQFSGDEADALADLLLCETLKTDRGSLLASLETEMDAEAAEKAGEAAIRLSQGVPPQYVFGYCDFYGKRISVGSGCFIPRADTETLVRAAVAYIGDKKTLFADICAGSGCVALAVASEKPQASGYALELSRKALVYAEKNLGTLENMIIKRFDALDPEDYIALLEQSGKKFDLILSNPPYIPTGEIASLETQVLCEPETALDGGEDGLRFYREIIKNSSLILNGDGVIMFETGINQAEEVAGSLELYGFETALLKDYSGVDRVVIGKKY